MWLEDSVALVRMWILHLQALLLLLCFHGDIVTYCCTETFYPDKTWCLCHVRDKVHTYRKEQLNFRLVSQNLKINFTPPPPLPKVQHPP